MCAAVILRRNTISVFLISSLQILVPSNFLENSVDVDGTECPPNFTGQIPYTMDCRQFLNCWKGHGSIQSCAPGTMFNPKTMECDHPSKVKCKKFDGFNTRHSRNLAYPPGLESARRVECEPGASGLYPHPTDCKKFLNCDNGRTFVQDCGPGTAFNGITKVCDWPQNVDCAAGGSGDREHSGEGEEPFYGEGLIDARMMPNSPRTSNYKANSYTKRNHEGQSGTQSAVPLARYEGGGQAYGANTHQGQASNSYATSSSSSSNSYSSSSTLSGTKSGSSASSNANAGSTQTPGYGPTRSTYGANYDGSGKLTNLESGNQLEGHAAGGYQQNEQSSSQANGHTNKNVRCKLGVSGIYPHPYDCSRFLNCDRGTTFVQDCGPGTAFNPKLSVCDYPEFVKCPPNLGLDEFNHHFILVEDSNSLDEGHDLSYNQHSSGQHNYQNVDGHGANVHGNQGQAQSRHPSGSNIPSDIQPEGPSSHGYGGSSTSHGNAGTVSQGYGGSSTNQFTQFGSNQQGYGGSQAVNSNPRDFQPNTNSNNRYPATGNAYGQSTNTQHILTNSAVNQTNYGNQHEGVHQTLDIWGNPSHSPQPNVYGQGSPGKEAKSLGSPGTTTPSIYGTGGQSTNTQRTLTNSVVNQTNYGSQHEGVQQTVDIWGRPSQSPQPNAYGQGSPGTVTPSTYGSGGSTPQYGPNSHPSGPIGYGRQPTPNPNSYGSQYGNPQQGQNIYGGHSLSTQNTQQYGLNRTTYQTDHQGAATNLHQYGQPQQSTTGGYGRPTNSYGSPSYNYPSQSGYGSPNTFPNNHGNQPLGDLPQKTFDFEDKGGMKLNTTGQQPNVYGQGMIFSQKTLHGYDQILANTQTKTNEQHQQLEESASTQQQQSIFPGAKAGYNKQNTYPNVGNSLNTGEKDGRAQYGGVTNTFANTQTQTQTQSQTIESLITKKLVVGVCSIPGFCAHTLDCSKFLYCDNGIYYEEKCGPGTLFNPLTKKCDSPRNVDCGTKTIPPLTITPEQFGISRELQPPKFDHELEYPVEPVTDVYPERQAATEVPLPGDHLVHIRPTQSTNTPLIRRPEQELMPPVMPTPEQNLMPPKTDDLQTSLNQLQNSYNRETTSGSTHVQSASQTIEAVPSTPQQPLNQHGGANRVPLNGVPIPSLDLQPPTMEKPSPELLPPTMTKPSQEMEPPRRDGGGIHTVSSSGVETSHGYSNMAKNNNTYKYFVPDMSVLPLSHHNDKQPYPDSDSDEDSREPTTPPPPTANYYPNLGRPSLGGDTPADEIDELLQHHLEGSRTNKQLELDIIQETMRQNQPPKPTSDNIMPIYRRPTPRPSFPFPTTTSTTTTTTTRRPYTLPREYNRAYYKPQPPALPLENQRKTEADYMPLSDALKVLLRPYTGDKMNDTKQTQMLEKKLYEMADTNQNAQTDHTVTLEQGSLAAASFAEAENNRKLHEQYPHNRPPLPEADQQGHQQHNYHHQHDTSQSGRDLYYYLNQDRRFKHDHNCQHYHPPEFFFHLPPDFKHSPEYHRHVLSQKDFYAGENLESTNAELFPGPHPAHHPHQYGHNYGSASSNDRNHKSFRTELNNEYHHSSQNYDNNHQHHINHHPNHHAHPHFGSYRGNDQVPANQLTSGHPYGLANSFSADGCANKFNCGNNRCVSFDKVITR